MAGPSLDLNATTTPAAVEDLSGFVNAGETVEIFNTDPAVSVYARTAATAPAATARGVPILPGDSLGATVDADLATKTWLWTSDPDGATVLIEQL